MTTSSDKGELMNREESVDVDAAVSPALLSHAVIENPCFSFFDEEADFYRSISNFSPAEPAPGTLASAVLENLRFSFVREVSSPVSDSPPVDGSTGASAELSQNKKRENPSEHDLDASMSATPASTLQSPREHDLDASISATPVPATTASQSPSKHDIDASMSATPASAPTTLQSPSKHNPYASTSAAPLSASAATTSPQGSIPFAAAQPREPAASKRPRGSSKNKKKAATYACATPPPAATTPTQGPLYSAAPASKRSRGRPPGSDNKKKTATNELAGARLRQHVFAVQTGEDIAEKITSLVTSGPKTVCIQSAIGKVATAALQKTLASSEITRHEGLFDIVSLSGSFTGCEIEGKHCWTGGLFLSLLKDELPFGGYVVGELIAASPVQVVASSADA